MIQLQFLHSQFLASFALLLPLLVSTAALAANQENDHRYSGTQTCIECHREQFSEWQGSHHDLAMQHANPETVLGDFSGVTFDYNNITSTFFKKDDQFWVNTDGSEGELKSYKIQFTFGVDPLQQYLIKFDDGRLQALSIAWDSRPLESGGQRWFHLYPNEQVDSNDVLHWTRQSMNWNLQCAACHSTNLEKNYDLETNSYQTTWFEMNVGCEACHGPASEHTIWATSENNTSLASKASNALKGFSKSLSVVSNWQFEEGKSTLVNRQIATKNDQILSCAGCHSRRSMISEEAGEEILDQYIPAHVTPELYHCDGQILDEVYVYGSFTQSKMHGQGVTCSNCHNPHSLELKAPGNAVCAQCHIPTVFDTQQHHQHQEGSSGGMCVNCHMPEQTYMVVDPRRDHSIRIPQPAISKEFGAPNACNQCHQDESLDWAVENYNRLFDHRLNRSNPVHAFYAASNTPAEATHLLQNIAFDDSAALMTRASAISRMSIYPSQEALGTAARMLQSDEALIRFSAIGLFEALPQQQRPEFLWPLLSDPVKAVRIEATRLLAGANPANNSEAKQLQDAIKEYEASIKVNADTPGGMSQLGQLHFSQSDYAKAEKAYQYALKLEPLYIPARLNLADTYRAMADEAKSIQTLKEGLHLIPAQPDLSFAAGLSLVRQGNVETAIGFLHSAATEAPENVRYSYVYAVALHDLGQTEHSIKILTQSLERHPNNRDLINALASYLSISGNNAEANKYRLRLQQLN